jgi:putative transposase
MYSLHVTVTREFDVPEPDTAETVGGVDINERNVSLTALNRETMRRRVRSSSIMDESNRNVILHNHETLSGGKPGIHRKLGDNEERFTEWV